MGNFNADLQKICINSKSCLEIVWLVMQNLGVNSDLFLGKSISECRSLS